MGKLPSQECIREGLLRVLGGRAPLPGGAMRTNAIYTVLAEQFGLTRSQRWGNPFDAKGSCWEFAVREARRTLQDEGWLYSPKPGFWQLTPAGHERAGQLKQDNTAPQAPSRARH